MPLHRGADRSRGRKRITWCCDRNFSRSLLFATVLFFLPKAVVSQDSGSTDREFFGKGVQISVTVHDDSGAPISTPATVSVFRGTIPSARGETSNGSAMLVVNEVGDFTVVASAPGFGEGRESVSVHAEGRAQVDIYLKRLRSTAPAASGTARPILAPKAKEALDKGLLALSSENTGEAEKQIAQAAKLAPNHPDVLYAQGVLRLKQQDFAGAQSVFEKVTLIDPGHSHAFAALGMALCNQRKFDVALAPLEKSLQLDPNGSWETDWAIAKANYELGEFSEALKSSQEAVARSNGKEPRTLLLLAQSLTAVGDYDKAAQVLHTLLQDFPERKESATARRWLNALAADGKLQSAQN